MRALVAVIFCAVFFIVPAAAQQTPPTEPGASKQVEALLRQAGLIGTWAIDCNRPAAPTNPYVSVSAPADGPVREVHSLGPDFAPNEYRILAAERVNKDRIGLEVLFQPGTETEQRQKLIVQVGKDARRTLFNQPADGPIRVSDGVVAGTTIKTPVLKRCE